MFMFKKLQYFCCRDETNGLTAPLLLERTLICKDVSTQTCADLINGEILRLQNELVSSNNWSYNINRQNNDNINNLNRLKTENKNLKYQIQQNARPRYIPNL